MDHGYVPSSANASIEVFVSNYALREALCILRLARVISHESNGTPFMSWLVKWMIGNKELVTSIYLLPDFITLIGKFVRQNPCNFDHVLLQSGLLNVLLKITSETLAKVQNPSDDIGPYLI